MKLKSLALLATSGLMAATLAYAVPALADDMSNGQTTQQDNSTDTNSQNSGNDTQNNNNSGSSNDNTSNSSDEGTPDTATGDDDY